MVRKTKIKDDPRYIELVEQIEQTKVPIFDEERYNEIIKNIDLAFAQARKTMLSFETRAETAKAKPIKKKPKAASKHTSLI
jgi:hypothetical protein